MFDPMWNVEPAPYFKDAKEVKPMVFPASFTTEEQMRQEMIEAGGKEEWLKKTNARMRQIEIGYGGSRSDVPVDPTHEYRVLEGKLQVANRVDMLAQKVEQNKAENERK